MLVANGLSVILLDRVTPTPAVSWAITQHHAAGGVVVTASHNSAEFNGIKYKPDFGGSAPPEVVAEIERHTATALETGVTDDAPTTRRSRPARLADRRPAARTSSSNWAGWSISTPFAATGCACSTRPCTAPAPGSSPGRSAVARPPSTELHGERNPGFGGMHPEPIDRYMPEAMERMKSGALRPRHRQRRRRRPRRHHRRDRTLHQPAPGDGAVRDVPAREARAPRRHRALGHDLGHARRRSASASASPCTRCRSASSTSAPR